jgi:hypothetical protein
MPQGSPRPHAETTRVTARGIPGALALGLLASLIAHTALYGGDHAMGGAYHEILIQFVSVGCGGFLVVLAALAWTGSGATADGSVLAARLTEKVPGVPVLAASAGLWFALGERIEPRHADAGLAVTLVVVFAAAWSLLTLVRWGVRRLAGAVIAISRAPHAERSFLWIRHLQPAPIPRRSPLLRRRFARPPPIANNCA